ADDRVDLAAACRQALDTLGAGRFRLSAARAYHSELRAQLDAYAEGRTLPGMSTAETILRRPRVAFLCSGTGSQWFGMCRQLVAGMPAFRRSLVRAAERIQRVLGVSVLDRLFDDESRARLDDMEIVQPMLFCVQVALAGRLAFARCGARSGNRPECRRNRSRTPRGCAQPRRRGLGSGHPRTARATPSRGSRR
ncbi:acyltransferase domain-containing protein, partial [Salinispora arenicola]|uniref:acyltransferase domain-containing protein n=1 Tax=Salinispora arenicola TaxID=168697 RepID=UPI0027DDF754